MGFNKFEYLCIEIFPNPKQKNPESNPENEFLFYGLKIYILKIFINAFHASYCRRKKYLWK